MKTSIGFCECGCGQKTLLCTITSKARGLKKGTPNRFIQGHHRAARTKFNAFWKNVVEGDADSCWEWQGYRNGGGYGVVRLNGVLLRAHRISYELHNGEIPDGLNILHKCDNPPCVNPSHLFSGSIADNNADMNAKGRASGGSRPGEKHSLAKFTDAQVISIRQRVKNGETRRAIAKEFDVHEETICRMTRRASWKHI